MAEEKKSVIVYVDWGATFDGLEDDEAGKLIKHFFNYVRDKNPTAPDKLTNIAFEPIKQQLKRDLNKWEQIKIRRSESGKKGGLKSGESRKNEANEASASNLKQNEANEAVNVNVNVNVNDTVINNKEGEPSEIEIEQKIIQMIVPNILKVWKDKNPTYFSHLETDSHAALQIAYNIAAAKGWKKAELLNEKENECISSFTKIALHVMKDNFWSSKTLEQIAKPNNWQKIVNEMNKRTQQPIAETGSPSIPKYNIEEQLKKYG